MRTQLNTRHRVALFVMALVVLLLVAADHPLDDHWGDVASGNGYDFGSKWIHTATSGVRYGLWGESASSDARGVFGSATSTSSSGLAIGVYGETDSPTGRGVHGYATSGNGIGFGTTGSTYSSTAGTSGMYGFNLRTSGATRGIQGKVESPDGFGVMGWLAPASGSTAAGVYGINASSSGVGVGVEGRNLSSQGWAGYFTSDGNGVYITSSPGSTGLVVAGGSKNAAVPTSDGDRLLYSEESTEVLFSDYGFGKLASGTTTIVIDPVYAETVNLEQPYHVFLQTYGDAQLYVSRRTPESFEVRTVAGSRDQNVEFSYRLVAQRLGYEGDRLELAPWVTQEHPYAEPRPLPEEPPSLTEPQEAGQ